MTLKAARETGRLFAFFDKAGALMKFIATNRFLRSTATDDGGAGGGGGQASPPAPSGEGQQQNPEGKKPGIIAMAMAGLQSSATLNQKIKALTEENQTLKAENERLTADVGKLTTEKQEYESGLEQLRTALEGAKEEKQTIDQKAAEKLRAHGVDPSALPTPTKDSNETKEKLMERLSTEQDPAERYKIQKKINKLEAEEV